MDKKIRHLYNAAAAGNANTDFTPNTGKWMRVILGHVLLTTDGTVASRRVKMSVLDGSGNVLTDAHAGATVAASQTDQHHAFMQGIYRETSFIDADIQIPIAMECLVPPDGTLRIQTENGVAGDSYSANFLVEEL
jgi:hypothetical protein